ncbi:MAG: hypothetical protein WD512_14975, partial [Candidatus Paceibacterota bacterium]
MSIHNTFYSNKTPFTQFFCGTTEGMKLRSGTVINHIKNTPLFEDIVDLYENWPLRPSHDGERNEGSSNYCGDCFAIINRLRFIERHHETLRNEPNLLDMYQYELNELNNTILAMEGRKNLCECWHYFPWRVTDGACMLTDEYDYLASYDHAEYHATKTYSPTHPLFFKNRGLYRLYRNNF